MDATTTTPSRREPARPTHTILQALVRALTAAGREATLAGAPGGSAYFAIARELSPGSPRYARLLRAATRERFLEELEQTLLEVRDDIRKVVEVEFAHLATPA